MSRQKNRGAKIHQMEKKREVDQRVMALCVAAVAARWFWQRRAARRALYRLFFKKR